uniref:HNH nuclease domain-containing protein n=1 Tax=Halamphora calidilacuna TaxID=2133758 RepID=A0A2R4A3P9_9STRA|nr:hypothetical protein [Halamphora calidilacuna]
MFNSVEKTLNMFIFSINCLIAMNDVLLRELRLKKVGIIKSHALYNPIIKRPICIFFGRMVKSSYLSEAALTGDWDYDGFPPNPLGLYAQDIISQMIVSINRIRGIAYRSTEKKTLTCNATIKFKLGNLVKIYIFRNLLSLVRNLCLNKVFFGQLRDTAAGGKIKTKVSVRWRANLNSCAYRSGKTLLAFELSFPLITMRCFTTSADNKSVYRSKNLTNEIKLRIKTNQWITMEQKKLLIKHVEICQTNLSALSINKNSMSEVFYIMELLLNSLLFQVYAIEIFAAKKSSKSAGVDGKILLNTSASKLIFLPELKKFRKRKPLILKRIYVPKQGGSKYFINIPSVTDRLIQQLFVLVLDPFVESNSDTHSYSFRKGRNAIMAIGDLQKNLQSRVRKGSKNLEQAYVWDVTIRKYSDLINHDWLLKNTPFPVKYKYILKSWLKLGHIEFAHNQPEFNNSETLQVGTISKLLLNFTLNGLENLINEEIITYQKSVPKSRLKYSSDGIAKFHLFHKLVDGSFKERHISCRFFRYANNYIVLCSSPRLLSLIKKKTCKFLQQRGLVIHPNKTKTIKFILNRPFDFLGYTFIYLVRTKFIKNKMLHGSKPEYRLDGRPRLFVHPSRLAIKSFKTRLKNLLKKNYNVSAYRLITLLNPIIRGWVNYYSFSNSSGALSLLRSWIYKRIVIWLKRKHPKSGIIWLNKHYFLMEHLMKEHDLENNPKIADYIANLNSANQIQRNKWNFYGIARTSAEGYYYEVPRINLMFWPNSIKNITVASALVPSNKLLSSSYYLNQNKWLKEREKVERLHTDKENKLFSSLWKRDKGICFLCQTSLAEELTSFENSIEIHHIKPFAEGGSNKLSNMALVHLSCHTSWHQEYFIQSIETKEKLTKNRQKFK